MRKTKGLCAALGLAGLFLATAAFGQQYEVVYPLGASAVKERANSPALPDLNGKTICGSGHTFEGDEAVQAMIDLLRGKWPNLKFIPNKEIPDDVNTPAEMKKFQDFLRQKGCDAVISGDGC